ncbi:hypothetical protein AVEN_252885-1 [Araneus ventricosus]|uniref:Uncharacterized protein n=1 Tax=Araneus ventricosus TaxID=182803 RepID=A0A4Y2KZE4_ARAVE|nr:hypothetical protein AVEN_252885-1 [Araneus ventricosus]
MHICLVRNSQNFNATYCGRKEKIKDVISNFLENLPLRELRNVWFQHEGTPPHKVSSFQQYIWDTFQQQVIGYGGCVEWHPRSPDPNPLDFFCRDTSSSECMQPLHQYYRNFETVLRILVPACHLPSCTMFSGKCSPGSICVLLLKDTILRMTDR